MRRSAASQVAQSTGEVFTPRRRICSSLRARPSGRCSDTSTLASGAREARSCDLTPEDWADKPYPPPRQPSLVTPPAMAAQLEVCHRHTRPLSSCAQPGIIPRWRDGAVAKIPRESHTLKNRALLVAALAVAAAMVPSCSSSSDSAPSAPAPGPTACLPDGSAWRGQYNDPSVCCSKYGPNGVCACEPGGQCSSDQSCCDDAYCDLTSGSITYQQCREQSANGVGGCDRDRQCTSGHCLPTNSEFPYDFYCEPCAQPNVPGSFCSKSADCCSGCCPPGSPTTGYGLAYNQCTTYSVDGGSCTQ